MLVLCTSGLLLREELKKLLMQQLPDGEVDIVDINNRQCRIHYAQCLQGIRWGSFIGDLLSEPLELVVVDGL